MILGEPLLPAENMEEKSVTSINDGGNSNAAINSGQAKSSPTELDPQQRLVYLFGSDENEKKIKYSRNIVTTSRYTLISFLPKSLLEQFRRLANVYFLVIGIIAIIGTYTNYFLSSIAPDAILSPMVIVISISMVKDGIEDIKRHRSDMKVNSKPTKAVTPDGSIQFTQRQNLKVGSLVVFQRDDEVPADVVVLQCGGIQGPLCYVETAAIDGETNLKIRQPALSHIRNIVQMPDNDANLQTTKNPNKLKKNQSNKESSSSSDKKSASAMRSSSLSLNNDRSFVDGVDWLRDRIRIEAEPPNESIYRFNGCLYLKSPNSIIFDHEDKTEEIIPLSDKNLLLRGSVIRATEWCVGVVVYTGRDTKLSMNSKRPPSKLSSVDRIVNRTLLIAISVMIAVCVISMIFSIIWNSNNSHAKYLCLKASDLDDAYDTSSGSGCTDASTSSVLTIFTFATLYNNFVCISMYVSLEMVYLCQAFFLNQDLNLYDEESDTRAEAHSSGLCADLGQIQYILSDKTGTLTKNVMKLRRCALLNRIYGAPIAVMGDTSSKGGDHVKDYEELSALHPQAVISSSSSYSSDEQHIIQDFLRVLTVCNNVMLMPDDHGKLEIKDMASLEAALQAESADEVALVLAAALYSKIYLTSRSNTSTTIIGLNPSSSTSHKMSDDAESWDILAVNEFESDRKRMSVLVKSASSNRYVLFCKGADSSMFENCVISSYTQSILDQTERFASTGLRTLIAAKKDLSYDDAQRWLSSYQEAKMSVYHRDEKLSSCAIAIERDMDILGCIGIEDELQDGVSDAIRMLQDTGLNVWMITGDKAETAIAIGKMCSLVNDHHHIQRFVNLSNEDIHPALVAAERAIQDHRQYTSSSSSSSSTSVKLSKELSTQTIMTTPSPLTSVDLEANHRAIYIHTDSHHPSQDTSLIASKPLALVIDGSTLERIWKSRELRLKFSYVMSDIPTVIACRVSPLQKASLVRMIKTSPSSPITLAIGDGANDVGMINEARVGVGISGKEGRHAANASDFAISQFRFLVPLLLEHGRYNYIRCSKLVLYSFYKNLLLVSILFYYCIYSGFSGTIPLTSLVFTGYNFYLGLPIIAVGAFDLDIPKMFIYHHPRLAYNTGRQGELLNSYNMFRWCIWGFFIGFLIFVMAIRLIGGYIFITNDYNDGNTSHLDIYGVGMNLPTYGWNGGIYVEGFTIYTIIILTMTYKVIAMTRTRIMMFWYSIIISLGGYMIFAYVYGCVNATQWYNVVPTTYNMTGFWLGLLAIPCIITLFDDSVEVISSYLMPTAQTMIRKLYDEDRKMKDMTSTVNQKAKNSIDGLSLTSSTR